MSESELTSIRGTATDFDFAAVLPSGAPEPLAGKLIEFIAKRHLTDADADAVVYATTANGGIIVDGDGTAGTGTVIIDPAATLALPIATTRLYFALWLHDGTEPYALDSGTWVIDSVASHA